VLGALTAPMDSSAGTGLFLRRLGDPR